MNLSRRCTDAIAPNTFPDSADFAFRHWLIWRACVRTVGVQPQLHQSIAEQFKRQRKHCNEVALCEHYNNFWRLRVWTYIGSASLPMLLPDGDPNITRNL